VTGFYTPIESDFSSSSKTTIKLSTGETYSFNADFSSAVKVEGWGRTYYGWYLGFYNKQWHRSEKPLNAKGKPLIKGVVAVDNQIIQEGSQLVIPGLKEVLGYERFDADDVGSGIKSHHIDVYTGEGNSAKLLTYKITGQRKVCLVSSNIVVPVVDLTVVAQT